MRGTRFLALVLMLHFWAGRVAAQQEAPVQRHRIGGDIGFGSAVGMVGVDYQFAPVRWLRLEVGAGWGATGAQFSFMPKVGLGRSWRCAFTVGFGPSLAIGSSSLAAEGHGPSPGVLPWLNLDVPGIECRTPSGFSFQGTFGATMPLADFHWDLADTGGTIHAGKILPQGRAGIGWWF
jgi:hypothetical protein